MSLKKVTLEDKYTQPSGRVFLNGNQALARLPMLQHQRDRAAGLNTACFISGYRGSPLGGLDQTLWAAEQHLKENNIYFKPGINEDLAATAVWGSQQVNVFEGAEYDGVYAMWYGKGPGVDRSGDVLKHGNAFGTSKYGGVLAVAGDDHGCKSSTFPHQSEYAFIDATIPVMNPANLRELIEYGLYGWELSRYSGCWVGLKAVSELMDSSASVEFDPFNLKMVYPEDFEMPEDGVHARWPDPPIEQEKRLRLYKIYAAIAFARANQLNKIVIDSPNPRLGIITTGKSYLDVRQALDDLGIDDALARAIGLRLFKVGMSWPLEPVSTHQFAKGLEEVLVVEEKRTVIEDQLTGQLYNWPVDVRPRVVGEFDEQRNWMLPPIAELTPAMIAKVIAKRIARYYSSEIIERRLAFLEAKEQALAKPRKTLERIPYFCSGCPHNTSTPIPEGSRALGGIGCHYMAMWIAPNTHTFTQMGGEGVTWIGQAPFTKTKHVFQNLGDGTYFHSGTLAIRAVLAAKVNITFKILYNDAVAMTGGQPVDGVLSVSQISHQLYGEGVRRIAVVSDDVEKYDRHEFAQGVTFHHRDTMDLLQRQLREYEGTSVIIYDQTCAAEKRRRRKRGLMEDPAKRLLINELVCEGCGDCSRQSNCLSILPLETDYGRKRQIDQDACNKDYSCLKGFCPSFITVYGGKLKKIIPDFSKVEFLPLPEPPLPTLDEPYGIMLTGVGGTGIITISAIVAMAAHLENKGCSTLDMTGLAQKFGAVYSHIRIANSPDEIHAVRIAAGGAKLLLGCDIVVAVSEESLAKLDRDVAHAVINTHQAMTGVFTKEPDMEFPLEEMKNTILDTVSEDKTSFVNATHLAKGLLGNSIAANLFLLGFAYQKGLVPVSAQAINQAIEINGVAIATNQQAFLWGRRTACDPQAVNQLLSPPLVHKDENLQTIITKRTENLVLYQDAAYAERYTELLSRVKEKEQQIAIGSDVLSKAVAYSYYKVLAYKDEYEVARLYTDGRFRKKVTELFDGKVRLEFNLAPPVLAKRDPQSGHLMKKRYGRWMFPLLKIIAKLKYLRGTAFDVFSYTEDRKLERCLITEFERDVEDVLKNVHKDNLLIAADILALPQEIRGFGHVKTENYQRAKDKKAKLLKRFYRTEQGENVVKVVFPEAGGGQED